MVVSLDNLTLNLRKCQIISIILGIFGTDNIAITEKNTSVRENGIQAITIQKYLKNKSLE